MAKGSSPVPDEPAIADDLRALVEQAQGGDPTGLLRLRSIVDNDQALLEYPASLVAIIERMWRAVVSADGPDVLDQMVKTAAKMRRDLIGDRPSSIETVLAERAVAAWMALDLLRRIGADEGESALKEACAGRLAFAYRRHDAALAQLRTLRRLVPRGSAAEHDLRIFRPELNSGRRKVLDEISPLGAEAEKPDGSELR
jgi:hypothetical protein